MAKISWSQALADYLKDDTASYASIAQFHGVSKQSVVKRAVKEGWQALRQKTLLKVDQKLPELVSESLAQTKARHASYARLLQDKAIALIESGKEPETFSEAIRAILAGVRIEREALGLTKDMMTDSHYELFKQFSWIFDLTPEELRRFTKAAMARASELDDISENTPQYSSPTANSLSDGTSENTPQTPS